MQQLMLKYGKGCDEMKRRIQYIGCLLRLQLCQSRTGSFLLLQFFLMYIYVKPLVACADGLQHSSTIWFYPYLVSNVIYLFLWMLGVIFFFSDVPFMQYRNMYEVIRIGRRQWAISHIITIFVESAMIMIVNFLMSIICLRGRIEWTNEWGKLLHTIAITNAGEKFNMYFDISYENMQKFTPVGLLILTLTMGTLVLAFAGLFMFAVSLMWNRTAAVAGASIMVIMIFVIDNVHFLIAKGIACFSPVSWMQTAKIGVIKHGTAYIQPSVSYMFMMLMIGIFVLAAGIMLKIRDIEFEWNKED